MDSEVKIDLAQMSGDDADLISIKLGAEIGNEIKDFCEKLNKKLSRYSLAIKLAYVLHHEDENPLESMAEEIEAAKNGKISPKKKRGRPRKS